MRKEKQNKRKTWRKERRERVYGREKEKEGSLRRKRRKKRE